MNDTGLGIDLTAIIEQVVGKDFRKRLGGNGGYRLTISQGGQVLTWMNLSWLSRLTIQVTGWDEPVMEKSK